MKYSILIVLLLFVGCNKSKPIKTLFIGFQVECYPADKSRSGIYDHYSLLGQGRNMNYDTSIHIGDTLQLVYFGEIRDLKFRFVKQDNGWYCIENNQFDNQ